jgi:hypothetical protein
LYGDEAKGFAPSSFRLFSGTRFIDKTSRPFGRCGAPVLPPLSRDKKITRDYKAHLKEFDPEAKPNVTSLRRHAAVCWSSCVARGVLSRERFVNALEAMTALDLGGYEVAIQISRAKARPLSTHRCCGYRRHGSLLVTENGTRHPFP